MPHELLGLTADEAAFDLLCMELGREASDDVVRQLQREARRAKSPIPAVFPVVPVEV